MDWGAIIDRIGHFHPSALALHEPSPLARARPQPTAERQVRRRARLLVPTRLLPQALVVPPSSRIVSRARAFWNMQEMD
jgi:hypothetical protein